MLHTISPQNNFSSIKNKFCLKTVSKLEVKFLIISDELSGNYKTWEKQWFINKNLRNSTNEDVKNDITANCIKKKWILLVN